MRIRRLIRVNLSRPSRSDLSASERHASRAAGGDVASGIGVRLAAVLFAGLAIYPALAQALPAASPVVVDRVEAVVNRHVILSSDIDEEIRLSVLDAVRGGMVALTRTTALDQLISRTLIEQQIRREDEQAAEPMPSEVAARLAEIRKELPACVRENCASDDGWERFLSAHDLTTERVEAYLRYRLEILRFIEERFRPGIHITPQDIEIYYRDTLLPLYLPGEAVPSLEKVSPRIEEILLQQHVNVLFDEWLTNLRKQGDVEVLDPALQSTGAQDTAPGVPQAGTPIAALSGEGKARP